MNSDINVDSVKQEIPDSISAFVNGKTVQHKDPYRIRIINPSDESVVTELLEADETLVNEAVCSASDAFAKGVWSRAAMDTLCVGLPYHHATLLA